MKIGEFVETILNPEAKGYSPHLAFGPVVGSGRASAAE